MYLKYKLGRELVLGLAVHTVHVLSDRTPFGVRSSTGHIHAVFRVLIWTVGAIPNALIVAPVVPFDTGSIIAPRIIFLRGWARTILLVGTITAIVIPIANPLQRNAPSVCARELVRKASGSVTHIWMFIWPIATIVITVAHPIDWDTSAILTLPLFSGVALLRQSASDACQKDETHGLHFVSQVFQEKLKVSKG